LSQNAAQLADSRIAIGYASRIMIILSSSSASWLFFKRVLLLLLLTSIATLIVGPYFAPRVSWEMLWLRLFVVAIVMMIAFFATSATWRSLSITLAQQGGKPRLSLQVSQFIALVIAAFIGTVISGLFIGRTLTQMFTSEPMLMGLVIFTAVAIGIGAVTVTLLVYKQRAARADVEAAQASSQQHVLEKQILEARLKLMQAQIEPHFLFNTLANVQHLVESNPPLASKVLNNLVTYLRAALPEMREVTNKGTTKLGREADMARAYLGIQAVRMGARLRYTVEVSDDLRESSFPPMMLMTLVENAIKHGIDPLQEGGEIRVQAMRDATHVIVSVSDTGVGITEQTGLGVGLANIRERLSALFGRDASLALSEHAPRGVVATLRVPFVAGVMP
jgi:sensor histidine kinase YesM